MPAASACATSAGGDRCARGPRGARRAGWRRRRSRRCRRACAACRRRPARVVLGDGGDARARRASARARWSSIVAETRRASRSARPSGPTAVPGARKPICSTASATGSDRVVGVEQPDRRAGRRRRRSRGPAAARRSPAAVIAARSDGAVSCTHWNVSGSAAPAGAPAPRRPRPRVNSCSDAEPRPRVERPRPAADEQRERPDLLDVGQGARAGVEERVDRAQPTMHAVPIRWKPSRA